MPRLTDSDHLLRSQYADAGPLSARLRIHQFGTNKRGWHPWIFDQLDFPDHCAILELGCGTGAFWRLNSDRIPEGWKITLTDFSPGMLDEARRTVGDLGREFRFEVVDAQTIPFDDESFGVVIANHMLYHVADRAKALSEIRRVLRPGGRLYASTVGPGHMRELQVLGSRFLPGRWEEWDAVADEFGLESGRAQLEEWFAEVELRLYEDSLEVPDAQAVVDYLLSSLVIDEAVSAAEIASLRQGVEAKIESAGAIRATKEMGLFLARRAMGG